MTPFIKKIAMPALSLTMAASIALTPVSATPARAGGTGTEAAVAAGFLALLMAGIVAGTKAQAGTGDRDTDHQSTWYRHDDPPRTVPGWPRVTSPRYNPPKPVLPRQCRVTYRLGAVAAPYYQRSCLLNRMRGRPALPKKCAQKVRIAGSGTGTHVIFSEACLTRNGFRPQGGNNRVRW